jgi:protocatechuate 3,4-dioxygenase alpha subunit
MKRRGPTPSQTIGPFFHDGLIREGLNVLAIPGVAGQRIRIEGHVYDGNHAPVSDAMVEIWQASPRGRYHHPADETSVPLDPAFTGFGRSSTDAEGSYWFETVKPGSVPFHGEVLQAPHINVAVFSRGLLDSLLTRMYFEDEDANRTDPVLRRVPADRRASLLAARLPGDGKPVYRFDIILQGDGETVFFDM